MDHQINSGNSLQVIFAFWACASAVHVHTHTHIFYTHMQAAATVKASKLTRHSSACICLKNCLVITAGTQRCICSVSKADDKIRSKGLHKKYLIYESAIVLLLAAYFLSNKRQQQLQRAQTQTAILG